MLFSNPSPGGLFPSSSQRDKGFDGRGAGVIVRREQDDILAAQSILGLDPLGHAVGEGPAEGDDVARDKTTL